MSFAGEEERSRGMGRIPGVIHEEIVHSAKETNIVRMEMDTRGKVLNRNKSGGDGEKEGEQ